MQAHIKSKIDIIDRINSELRHANIFSLIKIEEERRIFKLLKTYHRIWFNEF